MCAQDRNSNGWKVESDADPGKVTVRIISPDGEMAEAELDPATAKAFGGDIIENAQIAVIEESARRKP